MKLAKKVDKPKGKRKTRKKFKTIKKEKINPQTDLINRFYSDE